MVLALLCLPASCSVRHVGYAHTSCKELGSVVAIVTIRCNLFFAEFYDSHGGKVSETQSRVVMVTHVYHPECMSYIEEERGDTRRQVDRQTRTIVDETG